MAVAAAFVTAAAGTIAAAFVTAASGTTAAAEPQSNM
jgi:hypothetical protein